MDVVMKILSAILLLGYISFTTGKETSEMHSPAFANANPPISATYVDSDEDKSPLHEPAISIGKPHSVYYSPYEEHEHSEYHTPALANGPSSPHEHSEYHTPAMANGPSSQNIFHHYPLHIPIHATIISNNNSDDSSVGAAIVTAHKSPLFPGVSGISSYSNSNSEHIPAIAVSGVTSNEHPVATANPSKVPSSPHFSGYANFGGRPTNHQTHSPALANPSNTHWNRPGSIWDKASTHSAENTEKTVLKFPLIFSAISEFTRPVWKNFESLFPTHHRSLDLDTDLEASLPALNETNLANDTNLMRFEEIVQTNRQKWEIPIDEDVMKSPEFKNFWVVYKEYLEQQLLLLQSQSQLPVQPSSQATVISSLPKPESSNHVYDSYLDVHKYCDENKLSPFPLFQEDVASCRHFFKCYNGNAYHFHCATGTAYSPTENMCLYSQEVNCELRP